VPDPAPDEVVARYLTQSNHFTASTGRVSMRAFLPEGQPNAYETSVFRVQELTETQIWNTGDEYVAIPRGKPVYARAELAVKTITNMRLRVISAEPPPRHAVIVNWPAAKDERMSLAQLLAADATLRLRERETID
jgi:hypothetical protein